MILSRPKFLPQQRLDLEDMVALQSAVRTDSKLFIKQTKSGTNLIHSGFGVTGVGLKAATIAMTGATFLIPQNTTDFSWFTAEPGAPNITVPDADLTDGVRNYLELELVTEDNTPLTKAFWDAEANSGNGAEFNQIVDTMTDLAVNVIVSTGGFSGSPDRLPLAIIDVDGSGFIKTILDRRVLFGRLGTPSAIQGNYAWSSQVEPGYAMTLSGVSGTFIAGEQITINAETATVRVGGTSSITFAEPSGINFFPGSTVTGGTSGATGTVNTIQESFSGADKDLSTDKQEKDAMKTEIKRLKGTKYWYEAAFNSNNGLTAFMNSVIVGLTVGAKYSWSGTQMSISDADVSPSATDDIGAIRVLGNSQNVTLRRQDGTASTTPITINDGQVLFLKLPTTGDRAYSGIGSGDTNYQVVNRSAFVLNDANYWFAYREGSKLYVRGYGELMSGESAEIGDPISEQILTFIGATSEADDSPFYHTNPVFVDNGDSLTSAIGKLDKSLVAKSKMVGGGIFNFAGGSSSQISIPGPLDTPSPGWTQGIGIGQSFTAPGTNATLTSIDITLDKTVSGATGTLEAYVFSIPSPNLNFTRAIGTAVASAIRPASSFSSGLSVETFTFSSPLALTPGAFYAVVLINNSADISMIVQFKNNVYAGGNAFTSSNALTTGNYTGNANDIVIDINLEIGTQLEFDDDILLEVHGLDYVDNTIPVSESPILFNADLDTAYVIPNTTTGGPALSVTVDTLPNVPKDAMIIARIVNGEVIIGSTSMRLARGQKSELYGMESIQARNVLRSTDFLRSDDEVSWSGTDLTFTGDIVIESLNTRSGDRKQFTVLASNSPIAMADGEICYVAIDREEASGNVTPVVDSAIPQVSDENIDYVILFMRIDVSGQGYLHIPLHKQVLEPGQSVRLGASGSGSGDGDGISQPTPGYQALTTEKFDSTQGSDDDTVDQTRTTGVYDAAQKIYALAADKSKTVATSSGTGLTINSAPGFTVTTNCIAYITSGARAGQWRRIDGVGSQTSFTLDAAFSGGDASPGDTLMIAQAVFTKDLVNFGDAAQLTRPRDEFPSTNILQVLLDYQDSLVADDATPDLNQTARIVASVSNEGLQADTDFPLTSLFTQSVFTRPALPALINDYILQTNTDQQRLFLAFFPNPNNVSVTTLANLIRYDVSFYAEAEAINGGVLDSAYGTSDNSTTPYNMTVSTPAGQTQCDLNFSFNSAADPGGIGSQLKVMVDGKVIPKFVSSGVTPSSQLSYTLSTDGDGLPRRVIFNADLSVTTVDIQIVRQFGVYDASFTQSAKLTGLYDAIVGSASQVSAGTATHSSLQAAHDAVAAGSKILVLNNVTLTGSPTLTKRLMIEGKGPGSILTGDVTLQSGAAGSVVRALKVTGNIFLLAGADRCFFNECYITSGTVGNDGSNVDNELNIISE